MKRAVVAATRTFPGLQTRSHALVRRARELTPGGVHSNVRLSGAKPFIDRASGARMWDVDGIDYVDYLLGQGPNFLGHSPEQVRNAVAAACARGVLFGGQHELEIHAAELILEALQWPDMMRFNVSGTEAVQAALRLARAATGRRRVLRFEGQYHGWLDNVLMAKTSDTWGPASAGQVAAHLDDLIVIPWNDAAAVDRVFAQHGDDVAAIITEPMMLNAGAIEPVDGYLEHLRQACDRHGAVLIFDEVITGFRLALGGAAERFGVAPDLATYGKAMAGGWPVAAIAGRAELMKEFGTGRVNHSGTFNAGVMGTAAAHATVRALIDDPPYQQVERYGTELMANLSKIASSHNRCLHVQGLPAAFHLSFGDPAIEVRAHHDLSRLDEATYARFADLLVEEGVWVTGRGIWYVSAAHGAKEHADTLERFDKALARL